jgi:sporulation protein YlmC with PRC-barrel domain
MMRHATMGTALVAVVSLSATWLGAGAPDKPSQSPAERTKADVPHNRQGEPEVGPIVRASSLLDLKVVDKADDTIGTVTDVALDLEESYLALVVIDPNASLGLGQGRLALPVTTIELAPRPKHLTALVKASSLRAAPLLKRDVPISEVSRLWAAGVYSFFDRTPYWRGRQLTSTWAFSNEYGRLFDPGAIETIAGRVKDVRDMPPMVGMSPGTQVTLETAIGAELVQLGPAWYVSRQDVVFSPGQPLTVVGSHADVEGHRVFIAKELKFGDRTLQLRHDDGAGMWKEWTEGDDNYAFTSLSGLMEMPIVNVQGTSLGHIEDFAIAADSGLIAYAGVAVDGQPEAKLYPIPLSALVVKRGAAAWTLELPKDILEGTPTFDAQSWPETISRNWVEYVHVRYGRSSFSGVRKEGHQQGNEP